MVARALIFASVLSVSCMTFSRATAEDVFSPASPGIDGIAFSTERSSDTAIPFITFSAHEGAVARHSSLRADPRAEWNIIEPRRYEAVFAAQTSGGIDVALAPRAAILTNADGDVGSARAGVEARIGQRLAHMVRPWETPSWDRPTWYFFAASDGQALTWAPNVSAPGRTNGLRLQDRVEIGDMQAGVSVEAGGLQTSFAIVQRDVSGFGGSAEENFAGLTVTWRR